MNTGFVLVCLLFISIYDLLKTFLECTAHEFRCNDGSCIDIRLRCDLRPDCRDESDEKDCQCTNNEFRCANGQCIDESLRCKIIIIIF